MRLKVKFRELNQSFKVKFGEVHNVSDGGYERGYAEGAEAGYNSGYTEGETKGKEQGYTEGYNEGMIPSYYIGDPSSIYYNVVFPENFEFVLRIKELRNASLDQLINKAKNLKKFTLVIESSTVDSVSVQQFVRESTDTEIIDFTNMNLKIKDVRYFALGATKLKSIVGALDFSPCTSALIWLNGATALEDIEFVPNTIKISIDFYWCDKLTAKSVQSIIDGLADLTGSTAQKVTFHTTIINKLSAEQVAKITAKNWTIG